MPDELTAMLAAIGGRTRFGLIAGTGILQIVLSLVV